MAAGIGKVGGQYRHPGPGDKLYLEFNRSPCDPSRVNGSHQEEVPDPGTHLQGVVERVTYRHPDSDYTVAKISPERGYEDPEADTFQLLGNRITVVGNSQELAEGLRVRLEGSWMLHKQHGRQFRFETLSVLPPLSEKGLIRYLSSDAFNGIGPTLAQRIVEALGTSALTKIREDPGQLDQVKGLRPDVKADLVAAVSAKLDSQESLAFLYSVGLGPQQARRILAALGEDAENQLRANPYLLARGIRGIGFGIADRVAKGLGVADDAPVRLQAALLHCLREAAGKGHALRNAEALIEETSAMLSLSRAREAWLEDLRVLSLAGELVLDAEVREGQELIYLPENHTSECRLARNLLGLLRTAPVRALADAQALAEAEARSEFELHPTQRSAVLGLLSEPVALLTGGPGVGKTTIVRLVVELAERAGLRVSLASPTGRAAKRLSEATGRDASTVHRLLGWEPGAGRFQHHDKQPIEADLVVVDEISMLDLILAHHLVKALQPPTRLILVGDPNQLPSVAAGNVLADLLDSGCVPAFRLTEIYRQSAHSLIVTNAHRILNGQMPELPAAGDAPADFYFFGAEEDEATAERLVEVVTKRIPARFGLDWMRDVQVLSPMYKGASGVDALNARLREAQGIGGREISWRERTWREGDRVIHVRNDYEKGIFNGDMGRIESIDADGEGLSVRFPERLVRYTKDEFIDIQPAFAITVHRSQGGEFPCVVIPLVTRHSSMLQRHLLYTAITRAKQLVVLVGSKRALQRCIENAEVNQRESALADRLRHPKT